VTRREEFLHDLAGRIAGLRLGRPVRIGIDGVDGAGKTMLADELVAPLEALGRTVVRSSIDHFHRPRAERYRRGRQSPEGFYRDSFDVDAVVRCVLAPLGPDGSRAIRRAAFDHRADAQVDMPSERVPEDAVLLFDGIFLQQPVLRPHWDATVFLDVPFEVTVERSSRRDGMPNDVHAPEHHRYIEGQRIYLGECRPSELAAMVVDNADVDHPAVRVIRPPFEPGA
jgi:uridine kinase